MVDQSYLRAGFRVAPYLVATGPLPVKFKPKPSKATDDFLVTESGKPTHLSDLDRHRVVKQLALRIQEYGWQWIAVSDAGFGYLPGNLLSDLDAFNDGAPLRHEAWNIFTCSNKTTFIERLDMKLYSDFAHLI